MHTHTQYTFWILGSCGKTGISFRKKTVKIASGRSSYYLLDVYGLSTINPKMFSLVLTVEWWTVCRWLAALEPRFRFRNALKLCCRAAYDFVKSFNTTLKPTHFCMRTLLVYVAFYCARFLFIQIGVFLVASIEARSAFSPLNSVSVVSMHYAKYTRSHTLTRIAHQQCFVRVSSHTRTHSQNKNVRKKNGLNCWRITLSTPS